MQIFEEILFFKAMNLPVGFFQKDVCMTLTYRCKAFTGVKPLHLYKCKAFTSVRQSHVLEEPNWQPVDDLFVFVSFVALEKTIP